MTIDVIPLLIGLALALAIGGLATAVRFDGDRSFYPVMLIVIAAIYVLFATLTSGQQGLGAELVAAAAFVLAAVTGYRRSLWLVAAGLAAHGIFDAVHGRLIVNPGVPTWWPSFCATYDIAAAAYLAWRLTRGMAPAAPASSITHGARTR